MYNPSFPTSTLCSSVTGDKDTLPWPPLAWQTDKDDAAPCGFFLWQHLYNVYFLLYVLIPNHLYIQQLLDSILPHTHHISLPSATVYSLIYTLTLIFLYLLKLTISPLSESITPHIIAFFCPLNLPPPHLSIQYSFLSSSLRLILSELMVQDSSRSPVWPYMLKMPLNSKLDYKIVSLQTYFTPALTFLD